MKKSLRLLALLLALASLGFWAAKGAHTGWSQDRVPVKQLDEVTGLEQITYEDRYVPGLDFLGGGLALAGLLAGVSLFVRNQNKSTA
jgi:hypothetical protein